MEVQFVAPAGEAETFDIEVEGDHEFIANGLLVHNSAGMRQGDSNDHLFANAKDNLWQQDAEGNWRIDPERDALRMANHTRVFHRKPTSLSSWPMIVPEAIQGLAVMVTAAPAPLT